CRITLDRCGLRWGTRGKRLAAALSHGQATALSDAAGEAHTASGWRHPKERGTGCGKSAAGSDGEQRGSGLKRSAGSAHRCGGLRELRRDHGDAAQPRAAEPHARWGARALSWRRRGGVAHTEGVGCFRWPAMIWHYFGHGTWRTGD